MGEPTAGAGRSHQRAGRVQQLLVSVCHCRSSFLLGVYLASKKKANSTGPHKEEDAVLKWVKDGMAKAKGISKTLNQYLDGETKRKLFIPT